MSTSRSGLPNRPDGLRGLLYLPLDRCKPQNLSVVHGHPSFVPCHWSRRLLPRTPLCAICVICGRSVVVSVAIDITFTGFARRRRLVGSAAAMAAARFFRPDGAVKEEGGRGMWRHPIPRAYATGLLSHALPGLHKVGRSCCCQPPPSLRASACGRRCCSPPITPEFSRPGDPLRVRPSSPFPPAFAPLARQACRGLTAIRSPARPKNAKDANFRGLAFLAFLASLAFLIASLRSVTRSLQLCIVWRKNAPKMPSVSRRIDQVSLSFAKFRTECQVSPCLS